jgi:hypothetical protein
MTPGSKQEDILEYGRTKTYKDILRNQLFNRNNREALIRKSGYKDTHNERRSFRINKRLNSESVSIIVIKLAPKHILPYRQFSTVADKVVLV